MKRKDSALEVEIAGLMSESEEGMRLGKSPLSLQLGR